MTLTRFLCRIALNTLHSASKLLKAPSNCRFRTLTAMIVPSDSISLYIKPKPPVPSKLLSQKLFVPWESSWYDIILWSTEGNVIGNGICMLHCGYLLRIMTSAAKIIIDAMARMIYLCKTCFTLDPREVGLVQGGTPKIGFPQSASLPKNDYVVKFAKGLVDGIFPNSLWKTNSNTWDMEVSQEIQLIHSPQLSKKLWNVSLEWVLWHV